MTSVRLAAEPARSQVNDALTQAKRRTGAVRPRALGGPNAVLGLQRAAGNSAVNALMLAKRSSPGEQAMTALDGALREIRRDEPAIDTLETGLKAAKAAGVPVDLEGTKPPPSALAVVKTGFGPGSVPAKTPVAPAKQVAKVSPLGKAGAAKAKAVPAKGAGKAASGKVGNKLPGVTGGGGAGAMVSAPPTADQLLQPPVAPVAVLPDADPAFVAVKSSVTGFAQAKRAHPPAASKAREAQDAALAPAGDVGAQAKAAKADTMDAQQAGAFDKKAFIAAVKTAIEAKSPKTLEEADDYKKSGKADEVKGDVKGLVTQGKDGQAKDIEAATDAPPDHSKAIPKPVTPMGPEPPGAAVPIPAAGAVPKTAPAEQTNLAAGTHAANLELADADVSEPQLAESGEPEFTQALADKQAAATHADTAPAEFRQQEAQVIQQGRTEATAETATGVAGMQSTKGAALAALVADKGKTKTKDEAKRAEVTTKITGLFDATETAVNEILDGIDPQVEEEFSTGEAAARAVFENYVDSKMSAYKKDRYGGWLGGYRWAKDKLLGMPDKVNQFYEAGRELYLKRMDGVITRVANIVGGSLTAAKKRIATGKAEIAAYVRSLPTELAKVGSEASSEIGERFSELESEVDAKQESVVDTLATKYVEARSVLDERIEGMQAENKGLVDKAIGAINAVVGTIRQLAAMLTGVLARAASVVGDIIKKPINFLMNLIAGVKGGILKFKDTIVDHLRRGLMGWLFGALAEGGVELPDTFDVKGIIKLLASIFGLTWANIRNRLVRQIGETAMGAVEKGVEIFQVISAEGVGGLWRMLMEKLGDVKEMILEKVKDFVVTKIITAGITWLIGLLNPAAAFIKACKLIYDLVMFFVNNAARLGKFVDTIIDSVADMVRGNVSAVVSKINDTLGQMVPLIIGFFASAIGLGGIGRKMREIITKLKRPVNRALDSVISTGMRLAGPLIRGIKRVAGRVKSKLRGGDDTPEGKQQRLESGVRGGVNVANRFAGRTVGDRVLRPLLGPIRVRYGLAVLEPVKQAGIWAIHGLVSRMTEYSKARISEDIALREYEPTGRTNEQLALDRDLTPRAEETAAQARARSQAAESEIAAREVFPLYDALGERPPEPKVNVRAHEAAYGGHTIERHAPEIPLRKSDAPVGARTVEGRIYGDPPWGGRASFSYKWINEPTMNRVVNNYLQNNWEAIRSDLALSGRHEQIFNSGNEAGEGFSNISFGTSNEPKSVYLRTSIVQITIELIPGRTPPAFRIVRAFPNVKGY